VTADSEGTPGEARQTGAEAPAPAASPEPAAAADVLVAEHIGKRFGAVTALTDINLRLGRGEVLGLLGDNGAGKSTLLKILCGFQQPDSGRIVVDGEEVTLRSVDHARSLGIDVVYQDLALVNQLSVYHNMFLNRERVRWPLLSNRSMRKLTRQWLDEMGINIPSVDADVAMLSGGQRQAIAVARAVHSNAKILLLDEPLAAMGAKEGAIILDLVRDLKAKGDVSVVIIAHNYAQVLEICDRINLIQHGEVTFDKPAAETSLAELNDIVITEYRRALQERQREVAGTGSGTGGQG
jgi:simple sugar transport system ATP-binding protein